MKLSTGAKIGLVIGLIGALVGGGIAIAAEPVTAIIVIVSIVPTFAIIFFMLVKPSMEYSRIIKTGIQGNARIISLEETNTRINDRPVVRFNLEVTIPGKEPYNATTKSVVSVVQIPQLQPGTVIPIMVDQKNNAKVVIIKQGDAPNPLKNASPEAIEELKAKLADIQKENDRISSIGTYCKAIVTEYTPMGININGENPLVKIEMQVLPEHEPAFEAEVTAAIAKASVPKYQPGEDIFVKYDPSDKTKVAIQHS